MGSSVLDGRPTPAAEIGRFQEYKLEVVRTRCGHSSQLQIALLIRRYRLPMRLSIYKVEERLRCQGCGGKGEVKGIPGWRRGV